MAPEAIAPVELTVHVLAKKGAMVILARSQPDSTSAIIRILYVVYVVASAACHPGR